MKFIGQNGRQYGRINDYQPLAGCHTRVSVLVYGALMSYQLMIFEGI